MLSINAVAQIEPISIQQKTEVNISTFGNRNLTTVGLSDEYGDWSSLYEGSQWNRYGPWMGYSKDGVCYDLDINSFGKKIVSISSDLSYVVKKLDDGYYIIRKSNPEVKTLLKNEDGSIANLELDFQHDNYYYNYQRLLKHNGENYFGCNNHKYYFTQPTSQTGKYIIDLKGKIFNSKTGTEVNNIKARGTFQPFFLDDKFCINDDYTEGSVVLYGGEHTFNVFDVDGGTIVYKATGRFKFFSFDEKMIVTAKSVINSKNGKILLPRTIQGFSDDLLFGFDDSNIYNLSTGKLVYNFGKFYSIVSIKGNKVTTIYQDLENHVFDFERIKVYGNYRTQIDQEISAILPKDEFETLEAYNARLSKEKNSIFSKYENINTERSKNLIKQIQESYSQVQFTIESIGQYVPEREEFPITINGTTMSIKIPLDEARTFKPNVASAKVTASKQLNVTGTEYTVFNVKIAHPITGSIYPFGEQHAPLYLD
jgi:hypothetical protein